MNLWPYVVFLDRSRHSLTISEASCISLVVRISIGAGVLLLVRCLLAAGFLLCVCLSLRLGWLLALGFHITYAPQWPCFHPSEHS